MPNLAIRCIVLAHGAAPKALERTLATVRAQTLAAETVALTDLSVGSPSDLLSDAAALCVLHAGDALEPDAFALLAASLGKPISPMPTKWTPMARRA